MPDTLRSLMTSRPSTLVEALLDAYRQGVFPMADPRTGAIHLIEPESRGILPLDSFRVPRSLAQRVRSGRFRVTADAAFDRVIHQCAAQRDDESETWISPELIEAYTLLHHAGHAHSVEAWLDLPGGSRLVGGLYGVAVAGLFAGESMFSRPNQGGTDASKVCLVHLVRHLRACGFVLLDTQFFTPHLAQFGCIEVPATMYQRLLCEALATDTRWMPLRADNPPASWSWR